MGESARPTSFSEGVNPLRAALVLSERSASTPSSPSSEKRLKSNDRPSTGSGRSSSRRVDHRADRSSDHDGDRVGDRVGDLDELDLEGPDLLLLRGRSRGNRLLLEAMLDQTLARHAERQRVP